ncbi:MAG: hypothetical protein ACE5GB_05825, partial [Acidimicrobiales bacterium]
PPGGPGGARPGGAARVALGCRIAAAQPPGESSPGVRIALAVRSPMSLGALLCPRPLYALAAMPTSPSR